MAPPAIHRPSKSSRSNFARFSENRLDLYPDTFPLSKSEISSRSSKVLGRLINRLEVLEKHIFDKYLVLKRHCRRYLKNENYKSMIDFVSTECDKWKCE